MAPVGKRELFVWIGLAVVVLLLWIVFIVLGLPLWVPLALTLVPAVVFGVVFMVRYTRAVRGATALEQALSQQGTGIAAAGRPDLEAEIKELSDEFGKAVASLKASHLRGGGKSALYALPWYALIGPPGSGKSTALRNSGLHFPYLSNQRGGALKGVGGTRNCDWWLTNEGVLLDTAGRWSTQDDEEEWLAFLKLLKQHRRRQPLNGLIVAVSIGDVLEADDETRSRLARRLRERLDELAVRLGTTAPVYVLFTKCDLVPGFVDTFGELTKSERGQIWGFTASITKRLDSPSGYVRERFEGLVSALESYALRRMGQTRRVEERAAVFSFARQFAATRSAIEEFVAELFQPNVYSGSPILRGIYFSSATQEGKPVERLLRNMAAEFGIEADVPATDVPVPKSYFLNDVFSDVIFKDKGLAAPTESNARRRRLLRFSSAAAMFVVAALVAILPISAWGASQRFVQKTEDLVEDLSPRANGKALAGDALIARLDAVREAVAELDRHRKEGPPPTQGFGMYRGDALYGPLRKRYIELLRERIIRPVSEAGELDLRRWADRYSDRPDATPPLREYFAVYDTLKAYLYLSEPKEKGEPTFAGEGRERERAWLARQIAERWSTRQGGDLREGTLRTLQAQADLYLGFLLEQPDLASPRSRDAVSGTRRALGRVSASKLAIEQLVMSYEKRGFDLDLGKLVGNTGSWMVSNERIRGAFTRDAWDDGVRARLESGELGLGEGWVVAGPARGEAFLARARNRLREVYFRAYVDEWQKFIDSVELKPIEDNEQALPFLQELTRGNPPLFGRLLTQVHRNTQLPEPPPKAADGTDLGGLVRTHLSAIQERVAPEAAAKAEDASAAAEPAAFGEVKHAAAVAAVYEGLTRFAVPSSAPSSAEGSAAPASSDLAVYQEQLAFLRDALQMYRENPDNGNALSSRLEEARVRVLALLDAQSTGWRPRLESLLWPPIEAASASLGKSVATGTGQGWCDQVAINYERTIQGRYPFSHRAEDVAIEDFSAFYAPSTGKLWAFYEQVLSKQVRKDGDGFRFVTKHGQESEAMYRQNLLTFLEESQSVTRAFFPPEGGKAQVELDILIHPAPGIASTTLRAHGKTVVYRNGPEQWTRFTWPGVKPADGASLEAVGAGGRGARFKETGEWGLFRMLERAHVVPSSENSRTLLLGFPIEQDGAEITIEVRAVRADSPLQFRSRTGSGGMLERLRSRELRAPKSIVEGAARCGG